MQTLTRPQKILGIMFELCQGQQKALQYEDIVVAAFRRYPEDFQLRGYPEYPDSSDIHKPLYDMKRQGLVRSANKMFELTPRGLDVASHLVHTDGKNKDRLTKLEEIEINRIINSAAFRLFQESRRESILDTDFFEYLGISVRTSRANSLGRLSNVDRAISAHETKRSDHMSLILRDLHTYMLLKFGSDIDERK